MIFTCLANTNVRYLGVYLAKDLKWNVHIGNITSLRFLKRNLRVRRSKALKEKAYIVILRPKLGILLNNMEP